MAAYDVIGNIALMNFQEKKISLKEKKKKAEMIFKQHKRIKTIVEKTDRIKGRLRNLKLRHLTGKRTLITKHKENSCLLKLDVSKCYFSPRLSEERKFLAGECKKGERILVMFSGIAPYPVVIAKNSFVREVVAVELGKECNKYAKENVKLNKLENKVFVIQGDVKKIIPRIKKEERKGKAFDRIIMTRPNLKYSFLPEALLVAKKGTIIYYHAFCHENDINEEIKKLILEVRMMKIRKKIKFVKLRKSADIAPGKYRYLIKFKVF